jgi:hypothetical protein
MPTKLTPDNQASIVITETSSSTDTEIAATTSTLLVSELEITITQEETISHGIGNQEPNSRAEGNRSYEVTFTLDGEDAAVFDALYESTIDVELQFQANAKDITVSDLHANDFTISVEDDGMVEYDSTMSALSLTDEDSTA